MARGSNSNQPTGAGLLFGSRTKTSLSSQDATAAITWRKDKALETIEKMTPCFQKGLSKSQHQAFVLALQELYEAYPDEKNLFDKVAATSGLVDAKQLRADANQRDDEFWQDKAASMIDLYSMKEVQSDSILDDVKRHALKDTNWAIGWHLSVKASGDETFAKSFFGSQEYREFLNKPMSRRERMDGSPSVALRFDQANWNEHFANWLETENVDEQSFLELVPETHQRQRQYDGETSNRLAPSGIDDFSASYTVSF